MTRAILHPEMATEVEVETPPENTPRKVWIYRQIDTAAMKADFFAALERHLGD